jgi:hypothetical protein
MRKRIRSRERDLYSYDAAYQSPHLVNADLSNARTAISGFDRKDAFPMAAKARHRVDRGKRQRSVVCLFYLVGKESPIVAAAQQANCRSTEGGGDVGGTGIVGHQ